MSSTSASLTKDAKSQSEVEEENEKGTEQIDDAHAEEVEIQSTEIEHERGAEEDEEEEDEEEEEEDEDEDEDEEEEEEDEEQEHDHRKEESTCSLETEQLEAWEDAEEEDKHVTTELAYWPPPYNTAFNHLHKPKKSFVENEDAYYATDLENEDECRERYEDVCVRMYLEACDTLGAVPVSYFMRHFADEKLVMRHHSIDAAATKSIVVALAGNVTLKELDLEDNALGPEGAIYLADFLQESAIIQTVNIAQNGIGDTGAQAICIALEINSGSITSVNMSSNKLTHVVVPFISAALKGNYQLLRLNLSHNQLGELKSGSFLHPALADCGLIELNLSWNRFRARSAVQLLKGIELNTSLTFVDLSYNGLSNDGAVAVGRCLRVNSVLLHLDITNNRISTVGAKMLAAGLKRNGSLQVLKIGKNPIGPPGALLLLTAVSKDTSKLSVLDITDVCVNSVFDKLHVKMATGGRDVCVTHGGIIDIANQPVGGATVCVWKELPPEEDDAPPSSQSAQPLPASASAAKTS